METLKDYIISNISEFGLTQTVVEKSTGIRIENLQRFPSNYTGPSLKELCDLLSLDEVDTYSRYQFLPTETIELLFDSRFLEFFLWMVRTDQKTRNELFKILEKLREVGRVKPDRP